MCLGKKIIYFGGFSKEDNPSPSIWVAKHIFVESLKNNYNSKYICYFQDGNKYGRLQKLFGLIEEDENVQRMGVFRILFYLIRFRPDIIHLVTLEAYYIPFLLLKKLFGYRIYYTVHGIAAYELKHFVAQTVYQKHRLQLTEHLILKHADMLFVFSRLTERFLRIYKKYKGRTAIINNGLENRNYINQIKNLNEKNIIELVSVGSFERREKGYAVLLEALSDLNYKFILHLCCSKYEMPDAKSLPDNVELFLHPPMTNKKLREFISEKDIYIASSIYENFGLGLLEALNTGIPFICSSRMGLGERFGEGLKENVYSAKRTDLLTGKIKQVINSSTSELEAKSMESIQFSMQYIWDKVFIKYINCYEIDYE